MILISKIPNSLIHIYYCYLSEENHEDLLRIYLPRFDYDYQDKIRRYRRWQDAQLSILGRILLFYGIKEVFKINGYDKTIKHTAFSKPYFEDNTVHFNISHSGEIVICAISDASEIGIDIEILSSITFDDFKIQMSENEWRKIQLADDKKASFFEYWTQKEAVIKAHGHGLSIPLKSFEIINNNTKISNENYYLEEIKVDKKYKCYIALRQNTNEIRLTKKMIKTHNLIKE